MSQKIGIIFVLILVFTQIASAQNENYDYNSDDSYKNSDFYSHSDPNQWDYDKVNWDKVDFSRAELYISSKFYNNIPDDKYGNLDYTRVDYSQVKDHNKIDSAKYFQDMGCSSCSLDRGGQNLKFSKDGITHQQSGDSVTIRNYPAGTRYVGKPDRIQVIVPEKTTSITIPTNDKMTIITPTKESADGTKEPQEVTLPDGTKISGKVSYDNGQAYVKKGDLAVVNYVTLSSPYNNIGVFFNGKLPDEKNSFKDNFVSFGDKKFVASGENIKLEFGTGNSYFNPIPDITSKPYEEAMKSQRDSILASYITHQNDFLSFDLKKGSLEIENRDNQNNLPFVKTTGDLEIQNNKNHVTIDGKEVNYQTDKRRYLKEGKRGSVYFELEAGGNEKSHYFFDDNHNIIQHDEASYTTMSTDRMRIKRLYDVDVEGYFSPKELSIFKYDLQKLSDKGILDEVGQPIRIYGIDRRSAAEDREGFLTESFVNRFSLGNDIFWTPIYDLSIDYTRTIEGEYERVGFFGRRVINSHAEPDYQRTLFHEFGHVVNNRYSMVNNFLEPWPPENVVSAMSLDTFEGDWKTTLTQSGVETFKPEDAIDLGSFKFGTKKDNKIISDPMANAIFSDTKEDSEMIVQKDGSFYATSALGESQAELFAMAMTDSDWFTNEKRVDDKLAKSAGKTKGEILEIRQSLAKLYGFDFENK